MSGPRKTAIVTGASQGIGAGIVKGFVERGFNVVASSRKMTLSTEIAPSNQVAVVDGDIGEPATAAKIVKAAFSRFKSIAALVNNAGIFFAKPFTDYTAEDFKSLVSTNLEGFLYVTQLAIKQMLAQRNGGSIVTITAAHGGPRAQPDSGRHGGGADDHQRRSRNDHPAPCNGVRERRHSRERRRPRRRLHAASPGYAEGRDGEPVADGPAFDGQGHHGCGHVPDRRRDGHRSDLVRGWRRAFRPLVIERSFRRDSRCGTCEPAPPGAPNCQPTRAAYK